MALRVRFQYPTGATLGYAIERLSDGTFYDFSTTSSTAGTFTATPATPIASLPADTGNFLGRYKATLTTTPASVFTNGEYSVTIHNMAASNVVIAQLSATMFNGDDAPVFATGGGSGSDPWATVLSGNYPAGTAGALLSQTLDAPISSRLAASAYSVPPAPPTVAQIAAAVWEEPKANHNTANTFGANLDAPISSRLAASAYSVPPAPPTVAQIAAAVWEEPKANHNTANTFGANLDAPISSRSTYAGGPVASVTAPVTVGTNNDKAGYSLSSAGLDAIVVEPGVNARQALSPILAAAAGTITGVGSGTITVKGGNVATTRIVATSDSIGNRTSITLYLPS